MRFISELFYNPKTKEKRRALRKNQTRAEIIIWETLRNRKFCNLKFRRQHGIGYYIADLYCAEKKIVVEIDGDSHYNLDAIEYDEKRTIFFNSLGIQVIRFGNNDVYNNLESVKEKLMDFISGMNENEYSIK